MEPSAELLPAWTPFYTIVGTSAAALIGLMFVVITLVGSRERPQANSDGISAFSTPTVIHFTCALLTSAVFVAPWRTIAGPAFVVLLIAIVGLIYIIRAIQRTRRMDGYAPDAEDWMFYGFVPLVVYGVLILGTLGLFRLTSTALFAVAFSVIALIAIGIRNSWDVVTYIAVIQRDEED